MKLVKFTNTVVITDRLLMKVPLGKLRSWTKRKSEESHFGTQRRGEITQCVLKGLQRMHQTLTGKKTLLST